MRLWTLNHTTGSRSNKIQTHLLGVACLVCFTLSAMAHLAEPEDDVPSEVRTNWESNWEVLPAIAKSQLRKADKLVVVSEPSWCAPCRQLEPVLRALQKEGYSVEVETIAEYRKRPEAVQISGVPTLVFYFGDQIGQYKGYHTADWIKQRLAHPND